MKGSHTSKAGLLPGSTWSPWRWTTAALAVAAVTARTAPVNALALESNAAPPTEDGESAAPAEQAAAQRVVHNVDIPAGQVEAVIDALTEAYGVTFTLPAEDIRTLPSPGARGVLTAAEAIEQALAGTGIGARFTTPTTVTLELRAPGEAVSVIAPVLPSPKLTAPLRDLPQTLTVIPGTVIQSTGSVTLVEALRTVPGITLGAGEGGNPVGDRPFLRGYDSQSSTFVDGMRDIGAQSREVFNLESVEVTKGPSGAFGGRGTAGGSLNLNSKMPRAENLVSGSFSPGTADFYRGTIDANAKISDTIAARLNVMGQRNDVAGRDKVHASRWGLAPTIAAGLGTSTRATLGYYQMDSDDLPDTGIPYNNPNFNVRADGAPRQLQAGDGSPIDVDRTTFYGLTGRDFRKEHVKAGTLRLEHDLSSRVTVRNITRYSETGQDYIWTQPDDSQGNLYYGMVWRRINSRVSDVDTLANQTDLYGSFDTGPVRHTFAVGLELSRERGENDSYAVATGSNRCLTGTGLDAGYNCTDLYHPNPDDPWSGSISRNHNPSNSKTVTTSAYLFDTLNLTRALQATLGLRLDDYGAEFVSARAAATGLRSEFRRDDTLVNYQAGLVFKPAPAGTVYVSYSTSSTPSGNALAQGSEASAISNAVNASLEPEKNRSIEGGVKWEVFGNRALLTAALFRLGTDNSRITLQDGSVAMAGEKRVQGLELGFAGRVTDDWQVFGGYTWLDAVLVRNGGNGTAFGLQDGSRFPNTPEHSLSLWSTYTLLRRLTAGGGVYYMSKVWGSQPGNKWVPSYWRADAMASYHVGPHLDLQLNVQNLLDTVYYDRAYTTHYASIAPGRSARIALIALY